MDSQFFRPENNNGFQYGKLQNDRKEPGTKKDKDTNTGKRDEDLIIEENTIYEIDRDCYERLKKLKKKI